MADLSGVELEAGFEQNYRVNPDDPYVMARASCVVRVNLALPEGESLVEAVADAHAKLMTRCQDNVIAFIAAQQAATQTKRSDL